MADKERTRLLARIEELRQALRQTHTDDVQRTLHEALRACEEQLSKLEKVPASAT
jgi:hypothetical protein